VPALTAVPAEIEEAPGAAPPAIVIAIENG
jgi:hypothetical protein